MLAESHYYFNKAADVLGLSDKIRTILLTPRRTIKVEIAFESENGELQIYNGYRVQHNSARGPGKGGLRFHPHMDEEHATAERYVHTFKSHHGVRSETLSSSFKPNSSATPGNRRRMGAGGMARSKSHNTGSASSAASPLPAVTVPPSTKVAGIARSSWRCCRGAKRS